MTLEGFLTIASFMFTVICYIGYRYCCENVYLKYKEQKVGGRTKRRKRKSCLPGVGARKTARQNYCVCIIAQKRSEIND